MHELVTGPAWGLPWIVAAEFYAVTTNPRLWAQPPREAALAALDSWIATPGVRMLAEPPGFWAALRPLLGSSRVLGSRVHDARVAGICVAAGVSELWTVDRDFSWFPRLRVRNPLVAA